MTRSKHNGCGKTCYMCRPWKFTGTPKAADARKLQEPVAAIPTEDLHPAEERLIEHDAAQCAYCRGKGVLHFYGRSRGAWTEPCPECNECEGLIPGTFIVCGEGGNYCSDACQKAAAWK